MYYFIYPQLNTLKVISFILSAIFLHIILCPRLINANPRINILLASKLKNISISGRDMIIGNGHTRKEFNTYRGAKTFNFNCFKKHRKLPYQSHFYIYSKTGLVTWNRKKYFGKLKIYWSKNKRRCDLVHEVPMNRYLSALLNREMSTTWPMEALKAQAIAARTYAWYFFHQNQKLKIPRHYDLENSERNQVTDHLFAETAKTSEAIKLTSGMILSTSKNKLVPTFYHAKCGGHIFSPENIWQNPVEGHTSLVCPYCHGVGPKTTTNSVKKTEIIRILNKEIKNIQAKNKTVIRKRKNDLHIMKDHFYREKLRIYKGMNTYLIPKSRLRKYSKFKFLKSNNFMITQNNKKFIIKNKGFGHGVGLCQYGSKVMAEKNYTYEDILQYYYPSLEINKVY